MNFFRIFVGSIWMALFKFVKKKKFYLHHFTSVIREVFCLFFLSEKKFQIIILTDLRFSFQNIDYLNLFARIFQEADDGKLFHIWNENHSDSHEIPFFFFFCSNQCYWISSTFTGTVLNTYMSFVSFSSFQFLHIFAWGSHFTQPYLPRY